MIEAQSTVNPISEGGMWRQTTIKKCFTVRDLANAWDCSTRTIHRIISRGDLQVLRVGRGIRIPSDAIKIWANRQTQKTVERIANTRNLLGQEGQKVDAVAAKDAELMGTKYEPSSTNSPSV